MKGSFRRGRDTTDGTGAEAACAEERSCTCRRTSAANLQELRLRDNRHKGLQCNQPHGVQLAAHTTWKPTTLTAAAAATSCRSAQRAGAIKLDRRPEKAGQERARQRRPEEQCRHLFVQITCTAEALHSRWAQLLEKVVLLVDIDCISHRPAHKNLGAASRSAVHEHDTTSAWPSSRSMEFASSWSTTGEQGADSATA